MANTVIKGPVKTAYPLVAKFWELAVQEINAGKSSNSVCFIPQPYREAKELAEESKNPILSLPKIVIPPNVPLTPTQSLDSAEGTRHENV